MSAQPYAGLLPCPFCGSPAQFIPDDSYGGCAVGCSGICDVEPYVNGAINEPESVKAKWNTRPEAAEAISSLLKALTSLSRKYAAAEMALDYAHSEGFEWPADPFGEAALAFADPTTVPEYAALNSDASTQTVGGGQ